MTISLEGMAPLLAKIARVEQLRRVKAAMRAAALHIQGKIATYPGPGHRPQPFKSDKQRRGFFYHLRHGDIEVPYRRGSSPGSQKLGSRWTIAASNNGLTQTIGNNASYGPLVQGPQTQTAYHATTGWKTTDQVTRQEEATIVSYLEQAIRQELE
jgi:hypothetical protein